MSKPQGFKKINVEDFSEKDRELVGKLAYIFNSPFDDLNSLLNKGLGIEDNLNQVKKDISVTVDSNGVPSPALIIKSGLGATCRGVQVIYAKNNTNINHTPSGTPFITFSDNNGDISVNKITNLTPKEKYTLRIILYP